MPEPCNSRKRILTILVPSFKLHAIHCFSSVLAEPKMYHTVSRQQKWNMPSFEKTYENHKPSIRIVKRSQIIPYIYNHIYIYHGPPKHTFLDVFMVNNLVFRLATPLFFMVLEADGIYHISIHEKLITPLQGEPHITIVTNGGTKRVARPYKWPQKFLGWLGFFILLMVQKSGEPLNMWVIPNYLHGFNRSKRWLFGISEPWTASSTYRVIFHPIYNWWRGPTWETSRI